MGSDRHEVRCPTCPYLSKHQLSELTGLSPATIQRYKDAGRIPFFQPGGKGGRVLFPADAIESAVRVAGETGAAKGGDGRVPGPPPRWRGQTPRR